MRRLIALLLGAAAILGGPLSAAEVSTELAVIASDDGLPDAARPLVYAWTLVAGPAGGTAVFTPSATVTKPTITLDAPGVYTVRITVSDGPLATSQDLQLLVKTGTIDVGVGSGGIGAPGPSPTPAESSGGGSAGGCGAGGAVAMILGAGLLAHGGRGRRSRR